MIRVVVFPQEGVAMSVDISHILRGWEYRPNEVTVRRIMGDDGREKIQMRLDLGILQMEVDGRPDGKRPYGKESYLEYYLASLDRYRREHGTDQGWQLSPEDAERLRLEAVQYYHRYLSFFFLEDYERLVRDTARNLKVLDLLWDYGPEDERWESEQYRPYIIMMNTRGRVSLELRKGDYDTALRILDEGITAIEAFFRRHGRRDLAAESTELSFLREWREHIYQKKPLTPRERLQRELEKAIQEEAYERAAQIRDRLRALDQRKNQEDQHPHEAP